MKYLLVDLFGKTKTEVDLVVDYGLRPTYNSINCEVVEDKGLHATVEDQQFFQLLMDNENTFVLAGKSEKVRSEAHNIINRNIYHGRKL